MIQALRDLIDLYTFYYDMLGRFLDSLLDLLCVCICQGVDSFFLFSACGLHLHRKRHTCKNWDLLSPTVLGKQRGEAGRHAVGKCSFYVRQALQNHNTPSTIR